MLISRNTLEFLQFIEEKGCITRTNQNFYLSRFGFYAQVWTFRDLGVLKEDGFGADTNKRWVLTDKGMKFLSMLKELKGMKIL